MQPRTRIVLTRIGWTRKPHEARSALHLVADLGGERNILGAEPDTSVGGPPLAIELDRVDVDDERESSLLDVRQPARRCVTSAERLRDSTRKRHDLASGARRLDRVVRPSTRAQLPGDESGGDRKHDGRSMSKCRLCPEKCDGEERAREQSGDLNPGARFEKKPRPGPHRRRDACNETRAQE